MNWNQIKPLSNKMNHFAKANKRKEKHSDEDE